MKTLKYIEQHGLEKTISDFNLISKTNDDLVMLNYNQIDSPKTNEIVKECRSLIIDKDLNIVSRSFDRFFNLGENNTEIVDWTKVKFYEKIDGSLIKIYNHNNTWHISTKGTLFGDSNVGAYDLTFKEMVLNGLGFTKEYDFQNYCNDNFYNTYTYICEVTGFENRVVKHYHETKVWLLAVRENCTGDYIPFHASFENSYAGNIFEYPKEYNFSNNTECQKIVNDLKNLDEGFVGYVNDSPFVKIKSPVYVAIHHIKGAGLTPKRIAELVLTNEYEEYLSYFPEDKKYIEDYIDAHDSMFFVMKTVYDLRKNIESQKEFSLMIKDYNFSAVLFCARKFNIDVFEAFDKQSESFKIKTLLNFKELNIV